MSPLHILVTRPAHQASALITLLSEAGMRVFAFPTLMIQAQALNLEARDALDHLLDFDYLIFVSPNAVTHGMQHIFPHFDVKSLHCAAVGPGTADLLREYGIHDIIAPTEGVGAQALLEVLQTHNIKNKRCLIFKGDSNHVALAPGLEALGAHVTEISCYHRLHTDADPRAFLQALTQDPFDALLITSQDSLQALFALVPPQLQGTLLKIPLITISSRIEQFAQQLGFHTLWLARDASAESLLACLNTHFNAYIR